MENILINNYYSSDDLIKLHRSLISSSRNVTLDNVNGKVLFNLYISGTVDFEDVTINGDGGTLTSAVIYSQHPVYMV